MLGWAGCRSIVVCIADGGREDETADCDGDAEGGGEGGRDRAEKVDDRGANALGRFEDQYGQGEARKYVHEDSRKERKEQGLPTTAWETRRYRTCLWKPCVLPNGEPIPIGGSEIAVCTRESD